MKNANEAPLTIGLTGGIASGKSTVAELFNSKGVQVIDTDIIAREAVEPGSTGLQQVIALFGNDVLNSNGSLNRAKLRKHVFADSRAREQLEGILHPLIRKITLQRLRAVTTAYAIVAVPLLIESNFAELVDRILVIDCPEEIQMQRLIARDSDSAATATQIIQAQISREKRLAHADDIIRNDSDIAHLEQQVDELHSKYLAMAAA
jgi:dephospho-CoA kinase